MMENLLINILINCQSHKFSIFQQKKNNKLKLDHNIMDYIDEGFCVRLIFI